MGYEAKYLNIASLRFKILTKLAGRQVARKKKHKKIVEIF